MNSPPRTGHKALAAIVLSGLILRLAWGIAQDRRPDALSSLPDQREYLDLGGHLARHEGLYMGDPRFGAVVQAYRTPGYPFLVSLCGAHPAVVRAVQAALDASSIIAIYLLARKWLAPGPCLVAAALVAFNPYLIFFSGTILTETLFTSMLCWGMAMTVCAVGPWPAGRGRLVIWFSGGLILALAVLVRPGAILLPTFIYIAAALANARDPSPRRISWPLPVSATMLLTTFLVLLPWAMRNRAVLGEWVWTATDRGITLYDGFNPDATGASDQRFIAWMPWTDDMSEVARSDYFAQLAKTWATGHPWQAAKLMAVKMVRTWSLAPLSLGRSATAAAGFIFSVILDLMVLMGLLFGSLPGSVKRLLILPAIYFTLTAALAVGSLRYRIPAEGALAVVAASALGIASPPRTRLP